MSFSPSQTLLPPLMCRNEKECEFCAMGCHLDDRDREEIKLCTSASKNDGAGVADDRANLDCMGFTALYTATSSKPATRLALRRPYQNSKSE